MRRLPTSIPDVILIETARHGDERGWLAELHGPAMLAAAGIEAHFIQANLSWSPAAWTVRGLHLQTPPHAQGKLVRVVTGRAMTVAVDVRQGSPWFGRHVAAELDAVGSTALYVPEGFAHGVLTLAQDTRIFWAMTAAHAPAHAAGIAWDDPDLALPWPTPASPPLVSAKDRGLPRLKDLASPFTYATPVAASPSRGA